MPSHSSVAGASHGEKEKAPRKFCADTTCMFRVLQRDGTVTPCPKHGGTPATLDKAQAAGQREGERPSLRSWLASSDVRREIAPQLDDVAYAKIVSEVLESASKNQDIKRCDLWSMKRAIARAASWDLVIGDKCFLIPRRDANRAWRLDAVLGYRGQIEILMRYGIARQVDARAIYKNEHFKPQFGTRPSIEHIPILAPESRGPIVGSYAWARLTATDTKIEVISADEIDAIRAEWSRDWADGDLTDLEWYAKKTAVRRLASQLPMSPRVKALFDEGEAA